VTSIGILLLSTQVKKKKKIILVELVKLLHGRLFIIQ
jgi:hypothetical protein